MSFQNMKAARDTAIGKLLAAAETAGGGEKKSYKDEREWKPTVDKAGNGYAVIRFLPAAEGQDVPWVRYWDHGFKGPTGRWYIEKSLTSIGKDDPVSEMNSQLWNSGREEDKQVARDRKRRLHYVSNIYVVSDPSAPENEGKVFLYQYGQKIYEKIMSAMQPDFPDDDPVNPFDLWEGADFKLKIRNVGGWRNYDRAEFAAPGALADDEEMERIYAQAYSLNEFTDPATFKSYDELKARLNMVLGNEGMSTQQREDLSITAESAPMKTVEAVSAEPVQDTSGSDDDDDDTMSYFSKLANED